MTKIKICGIKTIPDALAAIAAGADLLGFNFYPKSPRYITPEACAEITSVLREKHPAVTLVGVFVNSPADEIRATLQAAYLHLAQLHGDESPEMVANLAPLAFKAIRLSSSVSVRESVKESAFSPSVSVRESVKESAFSPSVSIRDSVTESVSVPALLVDAAVKGVYGGSGVTTDWSAAAELAKQVPLLLAGGLTPENVAEAIARVQPWGVDTASGVESAPGVKDPAKMQAFVKAVRDT